MPEDSESSEGIERRVLRFLNEVAEDEREANEVSSEGQRDISIEISEEANQVGVKIQVENQDIHEEVREEVNGEEGNNNSVALSNKRKRDGKEVATEGDDSNAKRRRMTAVQYNRLFKPQRRRWNETESSHMNKEKRMQRNEAEEGEGQNWEITRHPVSWRIPLSQPMESDPTMDIVKRGGAKRSRSMIEGMEGLELEEGEKKKRKCKRAIQCRELAEGNGVHPEDELHEPRLRIMEIAEEVLPEEIADTVSSARRVRATDNQRLRFPGAEPNQPRQGP